jgi:UDP-2,3-diacylglucosamine hydrolase
MNSQQKVPAYIFSDLHMFSCSSLYERYLPEIYAGCKRAGLVVMNGDTFDFKRSRFGGVEETSDRAILWLSELCSKHPDKRFEYVLGNHDSLRMFVAKLEELSANAGNLRITRDYLQLGSVLFLHGDVCDYAEPIADLTAARVRYERVTASLPSIIAAEIVTRLRLNIVEYIRHRNSTLAERILRHLEKHATGFESRTRHIFFGHTHVPFTAFEYRGIVFTNTGSAIRGLRFAPREIILDEAE